ncbi:MAG TPA: diacylglycerol kinase family protein [Vicinamibacterales bacterium]|nr:diacylglycerol kinase family protein [Vicinamibacterales bacterium]
MSRARLILNPAAGTDQALAYAQVLNQRLRGRFGPVEVVLTTGSGDAEAAAARAVRDDCDVLFVGGGDGTLNEALNGVAAEPDGLDRVTFGVIPLGTGNDFARALGLPLDAEAALAALLAGHSVGVDVGVLNGRRFVNVSAGGFIAAVSEAVTPELKSLAGRLAYLLGGAQALVEFEPVRATMLAEPGGIRLGAGIYAFAACNAPLIGGGSLIAPHARIDDGLLDFCVIETMSAVEFLALLRRVADGEHVGDSRVRYVQGTRATFQFDRPVLVNTDGEVLEAETCEYSLLPKAGRFLRTE